MVIRYSWRWQLFGGTRTCLKILYRRNKWVSRLSFYARMLILAPKCNADLRNSIHNFKNMSYGKYLGKNSSFKKLAHQRRSYYSVNQWKHSGEICNFTFASCRRCVFHIRSNLLEQVLIEYLIIGTLIGFVLWIGYVGDFPDQSNEKFSNVNFCMHSY